MAGERFFNLIPPRSRALQELSALRGRKGLGGGGVEIVAEVVEWLSETAVPPASLAISDMLF